MGQKSPRELSSRHFTQNAFQYVVLTLREVCLDGTATARQTEDWKRLADWLGCANRPFTSADEARLREARIAFLHAADGAEGDTTNMPPPDISEIFERLSPAAPAIEVLKSRQRRAPDGLGRVAGSVAAGVVVVGWLVLSLRDWPDAPMQIASTAFPVMLGVVASAVWHGGPYFRPWKDGLIVAAVSAIVQALAGLIRVSNQRGTTPEDMAMVVFGGLVVLIVWWLSIALVTWLLNKIVPSFKAGRT
jgi:hypothetical protein